MVGAQSSRVAAALPALGMISGTPRSRLACTMAITTPECTVPTSAPVLHKLKRNDIRRAIVGSRQLRYFVAVARERNFTRAVEKLHIAHPPLSRAIQQLEDEFGVALFDRASRPLALTDAGRVLFEQAVQMLDRMDEMKAMVARLRNAELTRLGIGFVASTLYG